MEPVLEDSPQTYPHELYSTEYNQNLHSLTVTWCPTESIDIIYTTSKFYIPDKWYFWKRTVPWASQFKTLKDQNDQDPGLLANNSLPRQFLYTVTSLFRCFSLSFWKEFVWPAVRVASLFACPVLRRTGVAKGRAGILLPLFVCLSSNLNRQQVIYAKSSGMTQSMDDGTGSLDAFPFSSSVPFRATSSLTALVTPLYPFESQFPVPVLYHLSFRPPVSCLGAHSLARPVLIFLSLGRVSSCSTVTSLFVPWCHSVGLSLLCILLVFATPCPAWRDMCSVWCFCCSFRVRSTSTAHFLLASNYLSSTYYVQKYWRFLNYNSSTRLHWNIVPTELIGQFF